MAHLDKVASLAASCHARRTMVMAGCERIDFAAPAGSARRLRRQGRSSLGVEIELHGEALPSGARGLCVRGLFNMVAIGERAPPPPLWLRTAEMVFPGTTNHYGTLFGDDALRPVTPSV